MDTNFLEFAKNRLKCAKNGLHIHSPINKGRDRHGENILADKSDYSG